MAQEPDEKNKTNNAASSATEQSFDKSFGQSSEKVADKTMEAASVSISEYKKLQEELQIEKDKVKDSFEKLLRKEADLQNLMRRNAQDVDKANKFGLEKFIRELLMVLDSLEGGLSSVDSAIDIDGVRHGMVLTHKLFLDTLSKFDVAEITPQGELFNPSLHEAIAMQESNKFKPNEVMAVVQKGYSLNGRILRPARVVVAKAMSESNSGS